MIKHTLFLITIICLKVISPAMAQQPSFVDKDYRISSHKNDFFDFLVKTGNFSESENFKIDAFRNSFFVKKCIELYRPGPNILLVRFGSLGDHSRKYWAILNKKKLYMFYDEKDNDYKAFSLAKDPATLELLSYYMEKMENKNLF
ncbi:hypothetical protein LLH06_10150 [Mucilaginibacter daejeonensis]|uniref:hypothetical protein n=1 Tax=Mucilaginibacter daejeonensis TaxID=398049 RepID=UPI001D177A28|nr:hypothetical protein [Mucilaginibacter daejeonensis]UEG55321.1 hypothetical protein LLH06_10150 [Mucilaginibacter daejeonensis]